MSRRGWSTANFFRYGGAVVTAVPLTIACWAKTSITGSTQRMPGIFRSNVAAGGSCFSLAVDASNKIDANAQNDSAGQSHALTSTTISANTWFHACAVFASATSRSAYLNGAGKGTATGNITPGSLDRTSIGVIDQTSAIQPFAPSGTGDIAEAAIWNIALSDADVVSLALGIPPFLVHPEALVAYWPLIGTYSPEINLKSNVAVETMQGTLTASAHPRVFMPGNRQVRWFATRKGLLLRGGKLVDGGSLVKGRLIAA